MSYNRKIIRTSSYLEIWEYETPIFSSDNTEIEENRTSLKEKQKRKTFDELTSDEQEERIKRISKTRKNTKWKLQRLIDTNFDDKTTIFKSMIIDKLFQHLNWLFPTIESYFPFMSNISKVCTKIKIIRN